MHQVIEVLAWANIGFAVGVVVVWVKAWESHAEKE